MTKTATRGITQAWGLLVLLTLLSLAVSHSGLPDLTVSGLILAAAFAKGRWMMMDFLKLRAAPPNWRMLFHCWLASVALVSWVTAAFSLLRG